LKRPMLCVVCIVCLLLTGCNGNRPNTSATSHQMITVPAPVVQWYALGDSITQGYYSYSDEEGKSHLRLDER